MPCRYGKSIIGRKFGDLTVRGPVKDKSQPPAAYICQCICGKEITISSGNLTYRRKLDCGCGKERKLKEKQVDNFLKEAGYAV